MNDHTILLVINTILLLLAGSLAAFAYKEVKADIKDNRNNWTQVKTELGKSVAEIKMIKKSVRIIAKETNVNIGDE